MARLTLPNDQFELNQVAPVCLCCGARASIARLHEFRLEPEGMIWMYLLLPFIGWLIVLVRIFIALNRVKLRIPLCKKHTNRMKWPSYVGIGILISMIIAFPLILFYSLAPDSGAIRDTSITIGLLIFLTLPIWLLVAFIVKLGTPRLVEISSGSYTLIGVSPAFVTAMRRGPGASWSTGGASNSQQSPVVSKPRQPSEFGKVLLVAVAGGAAVLLLLVVGVAALFWSVRSRARVLPPQEIADMHRRHEAYQKERAKTAKGRWANSPPTADSMPPDADFPSLPVAPSGDKVSQDMAARMAEAYAKAIEKMKSTLAKRFPADQIALLKVTDPTETHQLECLQMVSKLILPGRGTYFIAQEGDTVVYVLAPIPDLDAAAAKLIHGKVTSIDKSNRVIHWSF